MLRTLLLTLLSHWRRRPVQFVALVVGLAVATALWSGVQALNREARASYDRAAAVLGADRLDRIESASGAGIAVADYVALRRGGWLVSPVLEGWTRIGAERYRVVGIDILTLPAGGPGTAQLAAADSSTPFLTPRFLILAHPDTAAALAGGDLRLRAEPDLPPGTLLMDIAPAGRMTGGAPVSYLLVADRQIGTPVPLASVNADLVRKPAGARADIAQLTDSFHLNLTAFGLLAFVVGLFIAHATIGLAFEQRRGMIRTLRATGASARAVMAALALELSAIALVAWVIGMSLGYLIAAALLPDVAASLRGLYGAPVDGQLSLDPGWWLAGLGMTFAGAGLASAAGLWRVHRMPVLAAAQPLAWHGAQRRALRAQAGAALALWAVAAALALTATGLLAGFAAVACLLTGAALLLPAALARLIDLLAARARGVLAEWFLAEARAQLSGLSLALMALLLALAINIGVGTMVASFRQTFVAWLDQRLAADLYLRAGDEAQADAIAAALRARPDVAALLPIWNVDVALRGYPVSLYGIADAPLYRDRWPLLDALPDGWDRVYAGSGAMVSEQMARRLGLAPGDALTLPGGWPVTVAGVYPDYGNSTGQAMVALGPFLDRFPAVERTRYGIVTAPGAAPAIKRAMDAAFALGPEQLVDQAALKAFSRSIFERTFTVTLALNALTFAVAGLALLTALLTLAEMRLPQVAPVWALGLTRRQIAALELARVLLLALLTALLAIPLGLLIAWALLDWINVAAFGWRIPLRLFPGQWAALVALATTTAALAAAWPSRHLLRMAPAQLLRVFADAR